MLILIRLRPLYVLQSRRVQVHPHNIGLAQQWYSVWSPSADNEAAFILEDDMEVSVRFQRSLCLVNIIHEILAVLSGLE